MFVIGIVLFQLFVAGGMRRIKTLRRIIGEKEKELVQMSRMSREHNSFANELKDISDRIAARDADFAIFSFLEQTASDLKIRQNIEYMKPSFAPVGKNYAESVVELKLNDVTLGQTTQYLFKIEKSGKLLNIKRLDIKTGTGSISNLDVVFEVSTLVPD